jgi:hypothetical protein
MLLLIACHTPAPDTAPQGPDSAPAPDTAAAPDSVEYIPGDSARPMADVRINELMSDNHAWEDEAGETPDWVELYVPGADPVDLAGWTLDDGGEPFVLSGVVNGGGFVVLWCGGDTSLALHAPFALSEGETLTLTDPAGVVVARVEVPALLEDVSWGPEQQVVSETLVGDGTAIRWSLDAPEVWDTPGFDDAGWASGTLAVGFDGSAADAGDPVNAALDAPTTQSSNGYGFTGAEAVDGEPATFSHTGDGDTNPWWEVSLPARHDIDAITLLNRVDCCAERLYNIVVTVLDAGAPVWTSDVLNPVAEGGIPTSPGTALTLDVGASGDTVRVEKTAVSSYRSEWLSFAEVVVTGTEAAPYADDITTDVGAAPVYVRAPVTLPAAPTRVTLDVTYDDGFVATIDGSPLAEANAGAGLALGEFSGDASFTLDPRLFSAGDHLLGFTAQNVSADDDDLLLRPTLVASWITDGEPAFFGTATPGAPNGEGVDGFLDAPTIDPPRGFYDTPFTATITAPAGATLVYTTDGSAPTLDNGTVVAAGSTTLEVTTTGFVRAAAFADGYAPSRTATHTWLFLEDVIRQPAAPVGWPATWDGVSEAPVSADYEMDPEVVDADPDAILAALRDLPTLSIVTDPNALFGPEGLYENSAERGDEWEKAVSAEWILPDGSTGFAEDCGARIHGWGWRYHSATKKHALRLEFSRDYGAPKLEYPVFVDAGVDRFDSIVLRAGGSKTWLDFRDPANAQYLHDAFARDTARDMGKADGHATFVHLYLNGLYWGLYNPVERPEAEFGEAYFGGDDDEYDAINRRTVTNEAVDGTLEAYNELLARADEDLSVDLSRVEEMLDLDDLIDYMLIHQYMVNRDGPCCAESNNMRGLRRRVDGEKFRFFVWDMEYSLWEATDATNVDVDVAGSISHVYTRLRTNADFRARYAERARLHLTGSGALTPDAAAARYAARAAEVHGALLAESARWGDTYREVPYTRDVEWQAEYDRLITDFFPARTQALIDQLAAAGLWD